MIPLLRIRYFHSHRAREKPSGTPKLRASPTRSLPTRRMQACPTPSPGPVASVSKGDKQKRVTDHTMFQPRKMFGLGVPRGWAELEVRLETAGSKNKNRFFEQFPHASRVVHACSACHGKQGLGLLGVAFLFFGFFGRERRGGEKAFLSVRTGRRQKRVVGDHSAQDRLASSFSE